MLIEFHNHLQKPLTLKCTRLLATSSDGTPLAFLVEYIEGHYKFCSAGDSDFNEQLAMHGFDRSVIVNKWHAKSAADGSKILIAE